MQRLDHAEPSPHPLRSPDHRTLSGMLCGVLLCCVLCVVCCAALYAKVVYRCFPLLLSACLTSLTISVHSNPLQLLTCSRYAQAPFRLTVCADALLVADLHAHMSTNEIIGLLGGRYNAEKKGVLCAYVCVCVHTSFP